MRTRACMRAIIPLHGTRFITWGEHDMATNMCNLVLARTPDARKA